MTEKTKKTKVYCRDCEFICDYAFCCAPRDTYYSPVDTELRLASVYNKNNDCPLFKLRNSR